jgi:hypothetical protein
MRIIVTGARDCSDPCVVSAVLDHATAGHEQITVVHGACHLGGADAYVQQWADDRGAVVERYPAADFGSWPECGPKRNQHMVDLGADLCLAFPGVRSRGTWDCVRRAKRAGIPVVVIYPDGTQVGVL